MLFFPHHGFESSETSFDFDVDVHVETDLSLLSIHLSLFPDVRVENNVTYFCRYFFVWLVGWLAPFLLNRGRLLLRSVPNLKQALFFADSYLIGH